MKWFLFGVLFLMGCSSPIIKLNLDQSASGNSLLPTIEGYSLTDTSQLLSLMRTTANAIATVSSAGQATLIIDKLEKFVSCYASVGAITSAAYNDNENPLSAGIVAIADKNEILDPKNLFICSIKTSLPLAISGYTYELCGGKYIIETPFNKFYVLFAGTTREVCEDICNDLAGCTPM